MPWPHNPTDIRNIPRLAVEEPMLDPVEHLTPSMVSAVCNTVATQRIALETVCAGDERAEAVFGSALIAAVQSGSALTDLKDARRVPERVKIGFGPILQEAIQRYDAAETEVNNVLLTATVSGWASQYDTRYKVRHD